MTSDLGRLWEDLLSEDTPTVSAALLGLPLEEREAALRHLRIMGSEPGWSAGQARRARAALAIAAADRRLAGARAEP